MTVYVSGSKTLRECLWLGESVLQSASERSELLHHLGAWLRGAHDAGLWQRDLKPNNVLVRAASQGSKGGVEFFLLDVDTFRDGSVVAETRAHRSGVRVTWQSGRSLAKGFGHFPAAR